MKRLTAGARRRPRDAAVCAAGVALTGVAAALADWHGPTERAVFRMVNDHEEDPLALRLVQQMGTPWVLPSLALAAAVARRPHLAAAAGLAFPVEKALEVGTKKARPTPRPLYVRPTVLRDDAPVEGESFPSGHAAIAFAAAGLVAPHLPRPLRAPVWALAGGTAAARVSQGAHHPVDAVGGAGLGVAIAAGLTYVVGRDVA
jgi:membrane-associated phospholipid phosphatase